MSYQEIVTRYRERTSRSRQAHVEAMQLLPLGVSSNFRAIEPNPIFIETAVGTGITDLDGNRYLDFSMAFGALLVGHAHPQVVQAIETQAMQGTLHAMPHRLEASVAQELRRRFGQEQWRYCNSGTEATMHALRLARGCTGKPGIIKFEGAYHGAHDALLVSTKPPLQKTGPRLTPTPIPTSEGIPPAAQQHSYVAQFNSLDSVRQRFEENAGRIAGLIVEPVMLNMGVTEPDPAFLPGLRELCDQFNALLIYDEVKTGVKIAAGGATEHYGIRPDIVVLAKAIGGGLPLAAFGAPARVMDEIASKRVLHVGTYASNPLSLAAADVTLREILTGEAYRRIFALNRRLIDGYGEIVRESRLPCHVNGIGPMGTLNFRREPIRHYRDWVTLDRRASHAWYLAMMNEGVIPQPPGPDEQWTVCAQHTESDIETHLEAFRRVAPLLKSL